MAIFRCSKCNHVLETDQSIGTSIACPLCQHPSQIWDTSFFVTKLLEKYFSLLTNFNELKRELVAPLEVKVESTNPLTPISKINLSNTDLLASTNQHAPLVEWLEKKGIKSSPNHDAVDTTGFFDEIASIIGNHYLTYKPILDQICFAYTKNFQVASISLAKSNPKETAAFIEFCRELYDYAFITRYIHDKKIKSLKIVLQNSTLIRQFFSGQWLEWFALMQSLEMLQSRGNKFSCARALQIVLKTSEKNEIDVFLLIDDLPIFIECKSGDYRSDIEKYRLLKKKLGIEKKQFIICVAGLDMDIASGLSSTYELTFCNESNLRQHIEKLIL